jgi:hypothetical protein
MLLCVASIWLPNDEWDRFEDSRDGTRGYSSAPDTDMRSGEVVKKSRWIEIIDRSDCDIDNATCAIKCFLECVMTAVFNRHLPQMRSEADGDRGRSEEIGEEEGGGGGGEREKEQYLDETIDIKFVHRSPINDDSKKRISDPLRRLREEICQVLSDLPIC